MTRSRILITVLVALIVGFGGGFVVRPVIIPGGRTPVPPNPAVTVPAPAEPRGKPYFAAHLDEARQILTGCADGSVRGEECFNAEMAVTEAEGRARHKKFFGN